MTQMAFIGGGVARLGAKYRGRAAALGEGLRPTIKEKADEVVEIFRENIDKSTPGKMLADLKESTKKQKKQKYGRVYPILKATGEFYDSMYSYVRWTGKAWIISIRFRGERNRTIQAVQAEGAAPLAGKRDFMVIPRAFRAKVFAAIRAGGRR